MFDLGLKPPKFELDTESSKFEVASGSIMSSGYITICLTTVWLVWWKVSFAKDYGSVSVALSSWMYLSSSRLSGNSTDYKVFTSQRLTVYLTLIGFIFFKSWLKLIVFSIFSIMFSYKISPTTSSALIFKSNGYITVLSKMLGLRSLLTGVKRTPIDALEASWCSRFFFVLSFFFYLLIV